MGIGLGEGILLALIAALFLKGDEFATAARTLGRWVGQAQKMSRGFMDELQREARDSGLEETTRQVQEVLKPKKFGAKARPLDQILEQLEHPESERKDRGTPSKSSGSAEPGPPPESTEES